MSNSTTDSTPGLTAEEIRGQYYGYRTRRSNPGSGAVTATDRRRVAADTSLSNAVPTDLTPTAKHVVHEAKKRLGQQRTISGQQPIPDEVDLGRLVAAIEEAEGEELSERERTAAIAALSASLEDYDVLTPLVENPEINDIIVRSYRDISIQSGKRNVQTDIAFADHAAYKSFVENLLKRVGKSCTTAAPVVDAAIEPHIRACVTHESFSPPGSGPMLTLRISRHRSISLDALVQYELAPQIILDYLATIIRHAECTMLIGGEVGTGKTTLAKALAYAVRPEEAILVIEDTHELVLERPFVRTLLTREANTDGAGRISPAQAIRTGMRMAMNRIILGEMRDAEAAEAFIDVCASGHSGLSTIHARSARDALARLELFLARAQGNIGTEAIRKQIANAVSVVVFLGLDHSTGKRRLLEVIEVGTSFDGVVQVSPMFSFSPGTVVPEWKRGSGVSEYQELLRSQGVELPGIEDRISLDPELMYSMMHGHVLAPTIRL